MAGRVTAPSGTENVRLAETILGVDDEADVRALARDALAKTMSPATDGRRALLDSSHRA